MTGLEAQIALVLAQTLIKYGPEVALAMAKLFKTGATIDQAIAALELAQTKTAQDYLNEAKPKTA